MTRSIKEAVLRYLVPQVVKIQLPFATNWRDFIYFFDSCFINVHIDEDKMYVCQAKLLYKCIDI